MEEEMRIADQAKEETIASAQTERKTQKRRKREKYRLTGSLTVKTAVFLLFLLSAVTAAASAAVCCIGAEIGVYSGEKSVNVLRAALEGYSHEYARDVLECLQHGYTEEAAALMADTNAQVQVLPAGAEYSMDEDDVVWQTGEVGEHWIRQAVFYTQFDKRIYLDGAYVKQDTEYVFRVCYDPEFPVPDAAAQTYRLVLLLYEMRYEVIGILAGCVLLCLVCLIFLLCSAGHRRGVEEIVPSVFSGMHFDVITAAWGIVMYGLAYVVAYGLGAYVQDVAVGAALLTAAAILTMLYLMEFAVRLKLGKWWRHTLIYVVLRGVWRAAKFLCRGLWRLFCGIPMVMTTVIVFLGICILEFIGVLIFVEAEGTVLWMLEKAVLLPGILYIALTCKKLQAASEAMAAGEENYVVDTSHMFGAFKEHGENLNSLSQGIAKAVEERMKSEHLKTELITNVSHDLKTPLTSIINYADLICEERPENPKIAEYAEVLLRQSGRLKKLLEDLVEASKATTGNLEVNLEPCEVDVLLSQAVGEYQQKMGEKGLELRVSQPEEPIQILADGRHLWRIFDNLLNNICKYAQENSRVYLSVEQRGTAVRIIFRNMSKYALDISAEELEERFVRGDKSRHMEGNGLGLSIAKSLAELQKGRMDIVIDGDLFKVVLEFQILQ